MSGEQDRLRKPGAPGAAQDTAPRDEGLLRMDVARRQRAIMRKKADAATKAGAPDLHAACAKDPMAARKLQDVMNEAAPRAVAARAGFVEGATKRLEQAPDQPLAALRAEGAQTQYLCLGEKLKPDALTKGGGVSRVFDLPSLFNYNYISPGYRARLAPGDADAFVEQVKQNKFNPNVDLDNAKELRGKVAESWWFPSNGASRVDLEKLRHELYIHDDPNYAKGAVRLDMPPAALQEQKVELFKPTAFDGLHQGWGDDPWWRASNDANWGLTKNSTKEAVMPSMKLEKFKQRSLMMPTEPAKPTDAKGHK